MPAGPTPIRSPALRHPIWIAIAVILAFGVLYAFSLAMPAFFFGFVAVLVAALMSFPVGLLSRWFPRGFAAVVTLLALIALIIGIGWIAAPPLVRQSSRLFQQIPLAAQQVQDWINRAKVSQSVQKLPVSGKKIETTVKSRAGEWLSHAAAKLVPAAFSVAEFLSGAFLVLILATFLVHRPESYRDGIQSLVPRSREDEFRELAANLTHGLRHWIGGIVISMTIMGIVTALGLMIAGIDAWFMLAVLTFCGTFIPYVGAIASAIPGLIIGLAESPAHFFYALIVYIGVHIVEGYIVQPLIMKRAVELRPATLLIWQVIMGAIFGIPGVIIATPLLVCIKITVDTLYVQRYLGRGLDQ